MKKTVSFSILVVIVLLAVAVIAHAQQPARIPLVSYLGNSAAAEEKPD